MLDALVRDGRHALGELRARRSYTFVSVLTLALVIGAASAVLAVVNATAVRPLPYPHGDRLVQLFSYPPGVSSITQRNPLHPRVFHRYREHGLTLVEAVEGVWARERALGGEGEPESISGASVSPGTFQLFGDGPVVGRTFTEDEALASARVVVISSGLWRRRFGNDASVIGRTVLIDREPYEVIGVMPAGFSTARIDAELWTPLTLAEAPLESAATFIQSFARIRPGATLAQLDGELQSAMARIVPEAPKTLTGWRADVASLRDAQFGAQRPSLFVLLAGVGALVLIACANLANVTLAHTLNRRPEIALRAALGASRGAIVRLYLIETLLIVGLGAAAGVLVGVWTLPALLALDPTTARVLGDVHVDWRVQAATAVVALAVAIFSGLLPVWRIVGRDAAAAVAEGNRRTVGSRSQERLRHVLVAAECAMAVVLLAGAALLLSAFGQAAGTNPGFDPRALLGAQVRIPAAAYPTEAARATFISRILERVRAVPGVTAAATTMNLFQPGFTFVTLINIEGRPAPDGQPHTVQFRRVSPAYFETMRIPLLRGRDFAEQDGAAAPLVTVVSQSFAERFWPNEDAVGRRIERGNVPRLYTVIGVVGDVSDAGFGQAPAPTLYLSYAQSNVALTPTSLVVRAAGDPLALTDAVRSAVLSVDPAQPIDHVTTLETFLADSLGPQRFRSTLLLVFGLIGLVLAAVGIYGVTARAVAERTRELGVRLALGASPNAVLRLVVGEALRSVALGILIGIVLAALVTTALLEVLPNIDEAERWTAVPAVAALFIVGLLAAAIPARRAVRVDPTLALRVD